MNGDRSPAGVPDTLQTGRLFQGLQPAALRAVVHAAQRRSEAKDAFFFYQGDPAVASYVVVRGRVRVVQLAPEGQQMILRYVGPGEMFGAVASLGEKLYPAAAQAIEDTAALFWSGDAMTQLMETYPRIAINALTILGARLSEAQDRLRELATERVERRVARAVLRLARQSGRRVEAGVLIDLPLSREDLAAMSGTTLYMVSRILTVWAEQGLVEIGRQRVVIRSLHGLVTIAEDLPTAPSTAGY